MFYNIVQNEIMKICPNCKEEVEESFDLCWNCNYSFPDRKVVELDESQPSQRKLNCLRCNVLMQYAGNYKFHEGARLGVWGNLFELFVDRQEFDLYACPQCGKVEFFVPVNEEERFRFSENKE